MLCGFALLHAVAKSFPDIVNDSVVGVDPPVGVNGGEVNVMALVELLKVCHSPVRELVRLVIKALTCSAPLNVVLGTRELDLKSSLLVVPLGHDLTQEPIPRCAVKRPSVPS